MLAQNAEPGSTVEVDRHGGEESEDPPVKISIVKPKERVTAGVGAQGSDVAPEGGDDSESEGSSDLPEEPEVLPDVPDAPPPPEGESEQQG